jgi:hypothetical protein
MEGEKKSPFGAFEIDFREISPIIRFESALAEGRWGNIVDQK